MPCDSSGNESLKLRAVSFFIAIAAICGVANAAPAPIEAFARQEHIRDAQAPFDQSDKMTPVRSRPDCLFVHAIRSSRVSASMLSFWR